MFALGIRYLNGWAMATHPSDREKAEWPPHPDRVFMALAAGYFETDGAAEERTALEWLQSLPPPAMAVGEASFREIVTSYVPVNDTEIARPKTDSPKALAKRLSEREGVVDLKSAKEKGLSLLPEFRSRQARPFPVAIPDADDGAEGGVGMPRVYFIWDVAAPSASDADGLASLCGKVTSVGHSASFVQAWVEPSPPTPTLVPVDGAASKHRLRVTGQARLVHLESRHKAGLRPASSLWQGYAASEPESDEHAPQSSIFDSNLVILRRTEGPRLGLESTLQLTEALRGTVMSKCPQPPPAWISGHESDGSPSQKPHLAFIPLPDVGHEHADGHLLGVAIAVPRGVSADGQKHLGAVLFDTDTGEVKDIELGTRAGVWQIRLNDDDERIALRSQTWTALQDGSNAWATVTPIVFDRHPKETWSEGDSPRVAAQKQAAYWAEVEGMIAQACENVGLPKPVEVIARPASNFKGAQSSGHMPRMLRKDGTQKRQTHAVIRFENPVVGPVLLGAGRYRGYGLCRPLRGGGTE